MSILEEKLDEEELINYQQAGKISKQALDFACKMVKPGIKLYEVVEKTEQFILKQNADLSFPVNISINNQAAHFTPSENDEITFGEKDVAKVDVGAHVLGYIGDNARTIDLSGEYGKLVEASAEALNEAIATARAGINTEKISEAIENKIISYGFKPVRNLSGHLLDQYELHTGHSLTNVKSPGFELEEDMCIAIEPFATTGEGFVREQARTEIFSYEGNILTRNQVARQVLAFAEETYVTLPFAERWLAKKFTNSFQLKIALRELVSQGAFRAYPILSDVKDSIVSQAEHTIRITTDSCEVLTE